MSEDKDTYLIAPEKILEVANSVALRTNEAISWVSDLNNVAINNLDKNLTKEAHYAFNSLWSGWYQKLKDLTEAYEGLAIVMHNGVALTLQEDEKSAEHFKDDPNTTSKIGKDIESINKIIEQTSKNKPDTKAPESVSPNNNTSSKDDGKNNDGK